MLAAGNEFWTHIFFHNNRVTEYGIGEFCYRSGTTQSLDILRQKNSQIPRFETFPDFSTLCLEMDEEEQNVYDLSGIVNPVVDDNEEDQICWHNGATLGASKMRKCYMIMERQRGREEEKQGYTIRW